MQWVSRVTAGCQEWREGSEEKERGGKKHEIIFRFILYLLALSLSCNAIL